MAMFLLVALDRKYPGKIWSKKWKLSVGAVHFSFFGRKYPFWANLVQKLKIVSLR